MRILREAKGLSQGDIERRSGLLRSYISRVEGGYTEPSLGTLEKFAKALELESYQILFDGQNGRPAPPLALTSAAMSKPLRKLVKMYEGMPSAQRRLLLSLAAKLAKAS